MEQLTIFEALVQFNESLANVKTGAAGPGYEYCEVLAIIPEDVLSPVEFGIKKGLFYRKGEKENQKKWGDYATAIWNNKSGRSWETACRMLEEYRDQQRPIELRIYRWTKFQPEHVLEYL